MLFTFTRILCWWTFGEFWLKMKLHGIIVINDLLKFFPNFFSHVWYKMIPFWHIWINLYKILGIIGRRREIVMQHKIVIPITRQTQERTSFPSDAKSKRTIWLDWTSKNTIITSTPCQCNVLRKNNKYTLHRKRSNLHLRCTYTMEIIWTHSNNRQTSKKATVDFLGSFSKS